jgi:hypothetical protein
MKTAKNRTICLTAAILATICISVAPFGPGGFFVARGADPVAIDSDHDGLSDSDEAGVWHTDPANADTDGDGFTDGDEVKNGYSPRHGGGQKMSDVDSDEDGLDDAAEIAAATDLMAADTDGDGYSDGAEVANDYSPRHGNSQKLTQVDSDKDYLSDAMEIAAGTGILNPDSDGDLFLDGTEVAAGYDPRDARPIKLEKVIKVDLRKQNLAYYFGDQLFDSFPISGGVASMPTPIGEFQILDKVPVKHYGGPGFDLPNTKWNMHFTTARYRYFIHGAYWHNNFGRPMSHGCVNVPYSKMEPLYWWTQLGTKVIIN